MIKTHRYPSGINGASKIIICVSGEKIIPLHIHQIRIETSEIADAVSPRDFNHGIPACSFLRDQGRDKAIQENLIHLGYHISTSILNFCPGFAAGVRANG